jgi:predicted  nucleic acid-binding Zn-ribbon protein
VEIKKLNEKNMKLENQIEDINDTNFNLKNKLKASNERLQEL